MKLDNLMMEQVE